MTKDIIKILKALCDENRLKIYWAISKNKLCVCEVEKSFKMSQPNATRHLQKLRDAKLIAEEKNSPFVIYGLNNETLEKYSFLNELLSDIKDINVKLVLKDKSGICRN